MTLPLSPIASAALRRALPCIACALLSNLASAAPAAGSSLEAFAFNPTLAPTGKVVHYVKSNLDGSKRLVLSLHFSEPFKMEALKVEADGQYLALVQAELDPTSFSEVRMQSFNQLERGTPNLQMTLAPDASGRRLVASVAGTQLPVTPSHWPAHIYNFDLSGLNATLPHLKDRRRSFEIGLIDPDFNFLRTKFRPDAGVLEGGFVDKGVASFRYLKDETLDEVPVHRFEVGGPAFQGIPGTLWINAKDGLIERFEHALPDNPDWNSFRLTRIASQPMTDAEWAAFKAASVARAKGLREAD